MRATLIRWSHRIWRLCLGELCAAFGEGSCLDMSGFEKACRRDIDCSNDGLSRLTHSSLLSRVSVRHWYACRMKDRQHILT